MCGDKNIKISKSFSTNKLYSLDMNYVQGDFKVYQYSKSIWSDSPSDAVIAEIVKFLKDTKLFQSVHTSKSRVKSDLILETNIEEFIQHFNDELDQSYVVISITFTVVDITTNKVIATKSFQAKKKSKTLDASGGVEALNKALSDILYESTYWFEEICK